MAAPASLGQAGRRDSSSSRPAALSHGRGGAGNMGKITAPVDTSNLETPTLKNDMYTTGRGGTGNMAKNNDPAEARRAQDVMGKQRRESTSSSHVGRGGAANIFHPSAEEIEAIQRENALNGSAIEDPAREPREKGFAEKGKDWLFGRKAGKV